MYQQCNVCLLDTTFSTLRFDENGQCFACKDAIARKSLEWFPNEVGEEKLESLVTRIKSESVGKPYDCVVGISGGIDSAFLIDYAVTVLGLNILAVHVDSGWNTAASVANIHSVVKKLNVDLYTHVVDWSEMRDLQIAFLHSSVLNQDIPQDHLFFSVLYRLAEKFGIRNYLSGVNFSTESIHIKDWGHPNMDGVHIRGIHNKFGHSALKKYKPMSLVEFIYKTRISKKLRVHKPLNFIDYRKDVAQQHLQEKFGWVDYGSKHSESLYTKFYQEIYLPEKYNVDKRKLHLSNLIVSGQIDRKTGIRLLEDSIIDPVERRRVFNYVSMKLEITHEQLDRFIKSKPVSHCEYKNQMYIHKTIVYIKKIVAGGSGAI